LNIANDYAKQLNVLRIVVSNKNGDLRLKNSSDMMFGLQVNIEEEMTIHFGEDLKTE